jgi:hypothetical protein
MADHESRIARLERELGEARKQMDGMDHKLDQLLAILDAAKVGTMIIKWTCGIGAAVATIWAVFHVAK